VVRGIVMILMALDHTRDFFGVVSISPTDVARASAPLFFTRWITHICAPTFFLLTGTGASRARGRRSTNELARLLFTRGLWLVVLEVTVVRCLAFQFNFDYHVTLLVVLWALGWAMITLAPLVSLHPAVVAGCGALLIALHNMLDGMPRSTNAFIAGAQAVLHGPGLVLARPGHVVFAAYPLIPWIGVTAVGFGLGELYRLDDRVRRTLLVRIGVGCCAAFVVLRWINRYGDPTRWAVQRSPVFTVVSFLNTTKYPPSLLFLLMTLGAAALLLAWVPTKSRWLAPALTYGRVPLFYFVLHLALIHALAILVCYARYGTAHWMFESPTLDRYPFTQPPGWGYALPVVYSAWAAVVVLLYPACRWFESVKMRRNDWWLSYM